MTNSQLHTDHSNKPTTPQLRLLRQLADERGVTFTYPTSKSQAHREIERLRALPRTSRAERRRELQGVRGDMATGRGDAARVRSRELSGFGSTAGWRAAR